MKQQTNANVKRPFSTPAAAPPNAPGQPIQDELVAEVKSVREAPLRAQAIRKLLERRANTPDLALLLWFSPGTFVSMLSDVLSFYPNLASGRMNVPEAANVYNTLVLFQVIANHEDTRIPFLNSGIGTYLMPFLKMPNRNNSESERLVGVTIGVFVDMVKYKQKEVLQHLLKIELVPVCLDVIASWSGVIRIAALFVLRCMTEDAECCSELVKSLEQVRVMLGILNNVALDLISTFEVHLSKSLIEVYTKLLSYKSVAQVAGELAVKAFAQFRPKQTMDQQFNAFIERLLSLQRAK